MDNNLPTHDSPTLAVLLERSQTAKQQLSDLTFQVETLRSTLELIQNKSAEKLNDVSHLRGLIEQQLDTLEKKVNEVNKTIEVLKTEISKLREDRPFINFLRSWSSYIGLLIISLIIMAAWNFIFNHPQPSTPAPTPITTAKSPDTPTKGPDVGSVAQSEQSRPGIGPYAGSDLGGSQ